MKASQVHGKIPAAVPHVQPHVFMTTLQSSSYCARCDEPMVPGAAHYTMTLRIMSGFDGVVQDVDTCPTTLIDQIVEETQEWSADDFEDTVDMKRVYTICPTCRKAILRDPLQRGSVGPTGHLS